MKILISIVVVMFAISFQANAETPVNVLSLALGASVPADGTGRTLAEKDGPSRSSGGEHFILKLNRAKTVSDIKITAYSTGHAGKALIHSVTGLAGATSIALPELSQFNKVTAGNPQNYRGLVMLTDTAFVESHPNQAFSKLDFVIEGYTNNDASVLIEVTSTDGFTQNEFLLSRTGPHSDETLGQLIDEDNYAKFTPEQLSQLMNNGTQPQAADLIGKTYVCSSYTKLDNAQIDFKTRAYFANGNVIQSNSDFEDQNRAWKPTADGLVATIANQNGCGTFITQNVLRETGSGNLISEIDLDLQNYLNLCTNAGYDADGTKAVELNSTFPSVISPKAVVNAYEFCRPAN